MPPRESIQARNERLFGTSSPLAMVTGSVARVGRQVADTLLNDGFRVVYHSHKRLTTPEQFVASLGNAGSDCWLVTGAVEEESIVNRWCNEIVDRYGRIDLLVNCAAIWDPKPLETTESEDFRRYFAVNAMGTALTCKHFGLQMTKQESGGAIVNIGDWAVQRPYRDFAAYFASKGSIETITQSMAVELATRNPNVRVNAVLPGPVMLADEISPKRREKIISESLLRRPGTPGDVASAVIFLATSPFVTGVCLPVDGGRTIYAGPAADSIAHPHTVDTNDD